jgi:alpha-galactosidase
MILSGDDLTKITPARLAILKKILPPTGVSASFNASLNIGWMQAGKKSYLILLNKEDTIKKIIVPLMRSYKVTDYWTDNKKGTYKKTFIDGLPPHSGKVYKLEKL